MAVRSTNKVTLCCIACANTTQIPLESVDVGSYDLMNVRRALAEKSNGKPPTPAQVQ
jgi:hypothetical protein